MKQKLGIVIAVFGDSSYLSGCLDSIKKYTPIDYRVEVLDTLRPVRIMSLSKVWNEGIRRLSNCSHIMVLNDDTKVTHGYITEMLSALNLHSDVGCVVPTLSCKGNDNFTTQVNPFFHFADNRDMQSYSDKQIDDIAGKVYRKFAGKVIKELHGLSFCGCCMLFAKELYTRVGGFDEDFVLSYAEDSNFFERVGFIVKKKIGWAQGALVFHYGGQTTALIPEQVDRCFSIQLHNRKFNALKRKYG